MPVSAIEPPVPKRDIAGVSRPTITPQPRVIQHAFVIPVVRELPPVSRPATFAATW